MNYNDCPTSTYNSYPYAIFRMGNGRAIHRSTTNLGVTEVLRRLIGTVLTEGEYEVVSIRDHGVVYKRAFRVARQPPQPPPPMTIHWSS